MPCFIHYVGETEWRNVSLQFRFNMDISSIAQLLVNEMHVILDYHSPFKGIHPNEWWQIATINRRHNLLFIYSALFDHTIRCLMMMYNYSQSSRAIKGVNWFHSLLRYSGVRMMHDTCHQVHRKEGVGFFIHKVLTWYTTVIYKEAYYNLDIALYQSVVKGKSF